MHTGRDPGERRDRWNWLLTLLAVVLASIHLYLGFAAPSVAAETARQYLVIAALFLAGLVVYFTAFWRPVLYLLGVGFSVYLGVLWVLGGLEHFTLGVLTGVVSTAFVLLSIYLFYREERFASQR